MRTHIILNIFSEIVYQISVATSQMPLGIFLRKKQNMTKEESTQVYFWNSVPDVIGYKPQKNLGNFVRKIGQDNLRDFDVKKKLKFLSEIVYQIQWFSSKGPWVSCSGKLDLYIVKRITKKRTHIKKVFFWNSVTDFSAYKPKTPGYLSWENRTWLVKRLSPKYKTQN